MTITLRIGYTEKPDKTSKKYKKMMEQAEKFPYTIWYGDADHESIVATENATLGLILERISKAGMKAVVGSKVAFEIDGADGFVVDKGKFLEEL